MSSHRFSRVSTAATALCTLAALAVPATTSSAATAAPSAGTYLVFLRSAGVAHSQLEARALARASQVGINSRLASLGARVLTRSFQPNVVTTRLTAAQAASLTSLPGVAAVLPNSEIPMADVPRSEPSSAAASSASTPRVVSPPPCGTASHPQLNPEALTAINAEPAITAGTNGAGVKVAFIADGIDTTIPDFERNPAFASAGSPAHAPVIADYQDFSGDGTTASTGGGEAFLDAGSIAAQGNQVFDLSTFVNPAHPLPAGCDIVVQGDAPGASVTALKVYANGATTGSNFVQAISYAISHGIKVLNESFGGNPFPDSSLDILRLSNDAAVAAGVTVVVSTGDAGITSTTGSPSTDPNVIAVGATTTFRSYAQYNFGGFDTPGIGNGKWINNNISSLSSGGFAQDGKTVDLVAPGDLNWAPCSASVKYTDCSGFNIQQSGGTSEAAPLTSGAAADVIQAYATAHHGTLPSPALVKRILTSTAKDISAPAEQQGAGLLNVTAAVALAKTITGTTASHVGGPILASTSQLDVSGQPNATILSSLKLTNTGTTSKVIVPRVRQLVAAGWAGGSVNLDPSLATAQPKMVVWSGATEVYKTATFTVPAGENRLSFDAAYQVSNQTSALHVALFNPSHYYAGYSLAQGIGGFAHVEVAAPAAGVWTAVFFTVWNGYSPSAVGTAGPIPYRASFYKFHYRTDATPHSFTLAPGHTATVTLTVHAPAVAGDTSESLLLGTLAVPVTIRTFINVSTNTGGPFHGVLTGGNGRGGAPAQSNTYMFKVVAGKRDIHMSLDFSQVANGDYVIAMLEDPNGQIRAYDASQQGNSLTPYVDLYTDHPVAGTWTLLLDWESPVDGVNLSVPFAGLLEYNAVSLVSTVPNSVAATVSQATGALFTVAIHNYGSSPMRVSPDARLSSTVSIPLTDVAGNPATQTAPGAVNFWYVPTQTSSVTFNVATVGPSPVTFDASYFPGDPDISPQVPAAYVVRSSASTNEAATYVPPGGVGSGVWADVPSLIGPYGPTGTAGQSETTTVSVMTHAFDPIFSSSDGDTVQVLTTGAGGYNPQLIAPGQTVIIPIHVLPTHGQIGTTLSGTLYLNSVSLGGAVPSTNELAALPYQFTVAP
jgi:hypothetical protein